ncbi:MAG: HAD family phosphatase [Clostridiaceae bacterium]|nr:HAD family phosphatase [Oscillospiraceae bacterium]NLO62321.1 HAD family phosphatase [Clostridiaceae bacterium]
MIEAVIFDMDGVLLDSEPLHDEVNLEILQNFGVEADKSVTNPYIGRTSEALWSGMAELFDLPESVEQLIERQWELVISYLPDSGICESDGLGELLTYIARKGLRASVASSSRIAFIRAVFDHLGLWDHMEGYTGGEEVALGKPAPDIYIAAAAKLGVPPENCMAVEDSTAGVLSAKAAGMFTVGYRNPTSDGQDVSAADRTVRGLREIIGILEEKAGNGIGSLL